MLLEKDVVTIEGLQYIISSEQSGSEDLEVVGALALRGIMAQER